MFNYLELGFTFQNAITEPLDWWRVFHSNH